MISIDDLNRLKSPRAMERLRSAQSLAACRGAERFEIAEVLWDQGRSETHGEVQVAILNGLADLLPESRLQLIEMACATANRARLADDAVHSAIDSALTRLHDAPLSTEVVLRKLTQVARPSDAFVRLAVWSQGESRSLELLEFFERGVAAGHSSLAWEVLHTRWPRPAHQLAWKLLEKLSGPGGSLRLARRIASELPDATDRATIAAALLPGIVFAADAQDFYDHWDCLEFYGLDEERIAFYLGGHVDQARLTAEIWKAIVRKSGDHLVELVRQLVPQARTAGEAPLWYVQLHELLLRDSLPGSLVEALAEVLRQMAWRHRLAFPAAGTPELTIALFHARRDWGLDAEFLQQMATCPEVADAAVSELASACTHDDEGNACVDAASCDLADIRQAAFDAASRQGQLEALETWHEHLLPPLDKSLAIIRDAYEGNLDALHPAWCNVLSAANCRLCDPQASVGPSGRRVPGRVPSEPLLWLFARNPEALRFLLYFDAAPAEQVMPHFPWLEIQCTDPTAVKGNACWFVAGLRADRDTPPPFGLDQAARDLFPSDNFEWSDWFAIRLPLASLPTFLAQRRKMPSDARGTSPHEQSVAIGRVVAQALSPAARLAGQIDSPSGELASQLSAPAGRIAAQIASPWSRLAEQIREVGEQMSR